MVWEDRTIEKQQDGAGNRCPGCGPVVPGTNSRYCRACADALRTELRRLGAEHADPSVVVDGDDTSADAGQHGGDRIAPSHPAFAMAGLGGDLTVKEVGA